MVSRKGAKAQRQFGAHVFLFLASLRLCVRLVFLVCVLIVTGAAVAQEESISNEIPAATPAASKPDNAAGADQLSIDQARLADRFKRLEEVVGRLAELSASTDPRRAKLLRDAIAQSREQDINVRFESVVKLLQDERLSAAATNQTNLQKELDGLLTLLLKADREKELNSERERIKQYLKEVTRLIREQKSVRARTQGDDDLKSLGSDQQRLAVDTAKLGGNIERTEIDKKDGGSKSDAPSDSKQGKDENEKPEDKKPDDKKSDDQNSDDKKPNENSKQNDAESGKPSDSGKPSEGAPSNEKSQPNDGKPSEGQSGKPSNSKPSPAPPSEGQPGSPSSGDSSEEENGQQPQQDAPADRATDRLKKAQQQMQEAEKKLKEAQRKGATDRQQQAIKELEQARAELERVLRQLREEELERTLTQLAARFRKMLEMQTAIYDGTVRVDQVPEKERTHDHEIESARLSREELQIVHEVDKALSLLHEEGSSVAFSEAVDQMRDDMQQVAERLAAVKVDKLTQGIEQDIIAALEETITALDKSIKDLDKKRTPPGQMPAAGQPGEMPLVDKLAELKMIRSLQMRINTRTRRYGEMIKGEQAETPDLLKSLRGLADRQQRVYKATADLQQKRND
jgi:hypothetical protein